MGQVGHLSLKPGGAAIPYGRGAPEPGSPGSEVWTSTSGSRLRRLGSRVARRAPRAHCAFANTAANVTSCPYHVQVRPNNSMLRHRGAPRAGGPGGSCEEVEAGLLCDCRNFGRQDSPLRLHWTWPAVSAHTKPAPHQPHTITSSGSMGFLTTDIGVSGFSESMPRLTVSKSISV